ncbi:hypothetical protein FisN_8Hh270 [Fistulifera solaris]|uniref:Protein kinase domain-containing protein n=1 Tax=Fistulifera solaris TaxID=1519565 RepID=A0A1Z5JYV7_FISSO|nr:hypothetical protein FisN_8Hh270 [Fistulifera solaris]|eukprot:GAX19046.1 hypothetical protein FisN_8Hh270 [Fistulifera solaris]
MTYVRSILRKRPIVSASFLGVASVAGFAAAFESRTERLAAHYPDNNDKALWLPREYCWDHLNTYWAARPWTTWTRFAQVLSELSPLMGRYVWEFVLFPQQVEEQQIQFASRLRESLTRLGPVFVKAGQQLSIRPDLVPPLMLKELQKLCDAVQPIPDDIALQVIRNELGTDLDELFDDMKLVAAASLGQVYKAKLKSNGEEVAIKVQRPDVRRTFSLDLLLLHRVGVIVDFFTATFTNQPPFHYKLYESFAKGSYSELDYENEASNQIRFRHELSIRQVPVVVPRVYPDLTKKQVITSEWIEGVKLADCPREMINKLIPVGVELFLTQLLDIGAFHSDPHPGNLLVTTNGTLCLLDFGLCAEVDLRDRNSLTKTIAHLITRDFDALVSEDIKELGFLPPDFDTTELKPLLAKILTVGVMESGSDLRKRKKKLREISNELNEVFFRYPFSVPPFFALVTRGLGLLEGIALSGDPDFDIFQASAPYARRRAVALLGAEAFRRATQKTAEY